MDQEPITPGQNVARNVATFMQWRGVSQEDLAERMTSIWIWTEKKTGRPTKWHRRMVNRVLSGDRPIDIDELYALALALDTTVGSLLSPDLAAELDGIDADFKIGVLDPVPSDSFRHLLKPVTDRIGKPRLGVVGWDSGEAGLSWMLQPSETETALRAAKNAFLSAHPDTSPDDLKAGAVLRWLSEQGDARQPEP